MRLINLDEKIFVPIIDEQIGASYEVQMTVAEVFDRFFEGNTPQIVDAIPVEWLKQKTKHPDNYTRASAKWMLGCWKREQEG